MWLLIFLPILGVAQNIGFAVTVGREKILKSLGGWQWDGVNIDPGWQIEECVAVSSHGRYVFAACNTNTQGVILTSTDVGNTWEWTPLVDCDKVGTLAVDYESKYAVASGQSCLAVTTNLRDWNHLDGFAPDVVIQSSAILSGIILLGGFTIIPSQEFYLSFDLGLTWTSPNIAPTLFNKGVFGLALRQTKDFIEALVVGGNYLMAFSPNVMDQTFFPINLIPSMNDYNDVKFLNETHALVAGDYSIFTLSLLGNYDMTDIGGCSQFSLGVAFSDNQTFWCTADGPFGSVILTTTDGGVTWTDVFRSPDSGISKITSQAKTCIIA